MENYAKRLAIEHKIQGKIRKKYYPIPEIKIELTRIQKAYEVLSESITLNIPIPPSGEWILDNFYIIEEQVFVIEEELKWKQYKRLPAINGKARILVLAEKLVERLDGNITRESIESFMTAYESKRKIEMEEIWCFPVMIKIALIKRIRKIAERIISSQYQKFKVASLIERVLKNK